MNDEEKDEALLHYMKFGYHHPSMTKEENAALTELKLHKEVPLDDEDFKSQFDLAHLPMKNRRWAYQMFRRQKEAFSKHSADLGCASEIGMKINPVSQDPHVQKYTPLPYPVRDQVQAILDQMLEYGIIRECDKPLPFCSNLLVVKKKNGKDIHILLDGRLNNQTRRLPTNLVTHLELYAHLSNAKYVTTIDLSDAFFQIPLDKESQNTLSFTLRPMVKDTVSNDAHKVSRIHHYIWNY